MKARKKTKNLVAVGTHVPLATKLSLQAIAEAENKSMYEFLQDLITREIEEFDKELNASKAKSETVVDGEDLLA